MQFILHRDRRRKSLRFASLESDFGRRITGSEPELTRVDSLIWVESTAGPGGPGRSGGSPAGKPLAGAALPLAPGDPLPPLRTLMRSDAALAAGTYLGGVWAGLAVMGRLVPRFLRDAAYDLVARNRHRVARTDSCLLPTPDERARFLDGPDAERP